MAVGQAQAHGLTFFGTHVSVGSRWHGNTLADQDRSVALGVRTQAFK